MRALFITSTRIGDAVLSTGILGELIRTRPNISVTIVCGPDAAPIFAEVPNLEKVHRLKKRFASLHWFDVWKECVRFRWDIIIDLRNSPVSRMLRTKSRYLLRGNDQSKHRVQQIGSVMGLVSPPSPRIWVSIRHERAAKRLLPAGKKFLAIGPMANWQGKEWPPERFSTLARKLTDPGGILANAVVLIMGSSAERFRAEKVAADISYERCLNFVGELDLLTTYAVLCECHLFVGNDSGLMHIAAAADTPTLGLFGPSREENYGPWGNKTAWVRTTETYEQLVGSPGYDHRTTGTLMSSLSVNQVEEAAVKLWHNTQGAN